MGLPQSTGCAELCGDGGGWLQVCVEGYEVHGDASHKVLPSLTGAPISLNQCPLALEKGPGGPLLSPVLPLVCQNVRRVESGQG